LCSKFQRCPRNGDPSLHRSGKPDTGLTQLVAILIAAHDAAEGSSVAEYLAPEINNLNRPSFVYSTSFLCEI